MDLDGIAVFVKVVQAGSFSQAAKLLNMPNSTVSAKVAALEKRLGVTLLQRTTRRLHLTEPGAGYFRRCLQALEGLQAAESEFYDPERIRAQLEDVERRHEAGELTDEEATAWEDELIERLIIGSNRPKEG